MTATFTLLGGTLTLEGTPPRPSEDALWLAASITPPAGARVLDACAGAGVVGLALLARCEGLHLTSLDVNPHLTARAARNAQLNHQALTPVTADLLSHLPATPYDAVLMNPPFHATARGHTTPNDNKAQAHSLPDGHLPRWLAHLATITTPNATLALVTHTACQTDIATFATTHGYAATFLPLESKAGAPPKRLITHLTRTGSPGLIHVPALPIHQPNLRTGVLTHNQPLPWPER